MATQTLAEQHQAGQEALVSLIPAVLREAWPLLDPHDIKGTLPQFIAAVRAVVARYGRASSFAALDYYKRERATAGISGRPPSLQLAPTPADNLIEEAVRGAVTALYGPVTPEATRTAQQATDSAVTRLVLDQGRQTVIDAVRKDTAAKGWVRVTEADACSFCIMLALRGEVYKSKRGAEFKAHMKKANGSGGDCRCHVEPVFTAYEPSARMREMDRLWKDSTKGKSGKDARIAFRHAVEGRAAPNVSKPHRNPAAPKGLEHLGPDELRHQIALTEGLKDSAWRTQQLARLRKALRTAQ